ncbi:MAG: branched-chain amino acid ABC transporter permease [Desulfurococcaceae archaeon]
MFLQLLLNSLLLSGLYTLFASGLNLVYGVMRVINYAQGEFLMISMYIAYWLFILYNIDPYSSAIFSSLLFFFLGLVLYYGAVKRLFKFPFTAQVLFFVGLIYFMQNLAQIIWSPDYRGIYISWAYKPIEIAGTYIPQGRLMALIVSYITTIVLYFYMKKTSIGLCIRAISQNRQGAIALGINIPKVEAITLGIGLVLVSIAGAVLMPIYYVFPWVGQDFLIISFIIITLGGLGSYIGTIVGCFIIAFIEVFAGYLWTASMARAIALMIYLIVLIIRPSGIMGSRA